MDNDTMPSRDKPKKKVKQEKQEGENPIARQIMEIEEELDRTKYNKATQGHIGRQKAKLARLREQMSSKSTGSAGLGYGIRKEGDATVVLVGFPSVGKSTLLNRISNAESKVGAYDFTTLEVVPGAMEMNGARIQVLDIPGIIEGVSRGKGRGKEVLSVARSADLVILVVDAGELEQLDIVRNELYQSGFRLDKKRPEVRITKRSGGGLDIGSAVRLTKMSMDEAREALREFRLLNAEVVIRQDITLEQLIDCIMDNRSYVPSIVCVNKVDKVPDSAMEQLVKEHGDCVMISAEFGTGIIELRQAIWRKLGLMRIYMKKLGREPDMKEPVIVKKGSTVKGIAKSIHKSWGEARYARVWGSSKFPGQRLGLDYVLKDRDIVEIHAE